MALDQSALLEVLEALKAAEVDDSIRQAAETIYQALIEAELSSLKAPCRMSAPAAVGEFKPSARAGDNPRGRFRIGASTLVRDIAGRKSRRLVLELELDTYRAIEQHYQR
jgi:hypothetical protein